jgi:4-hydroxy-4-methyl-2-oxoglutarate aldolase
MFNDLGSSTVQEINARWDKIEIANVYDALENLGYPNQCLNLKIKALKVGQRLSGPAVTLSGPRAPFTAEEVKQKVDNHHHKLNTMIYPGCVVVVDGGGEPFSAKVGEFESRGLRQFGANGIVVDGPVRDVDELLSIDGYAVFASGITPIPSDRRWYYKNFNEIIGITGTLTSQVRVDPGDWIVGGRDGVLVVPRKIMLEVLEEAEKIETAEVEMRTAIINGMPIDEARNIWGRH